MEDIEECSLSTLINTDRSGGDSVERLANLLEQSLSAPRLTFNDESNKLVHRISSTKSLPVFPGDPLEWNKFKQEFDISTVLSGYSDGENLMRLCNALKGDDREVNRSLFVAGNHSKDIIKTLEMRFGNPKLILNNIIQEIRGLPNIDSRQMSLVKFATRL